MREFYSQIQCSSPARAYIISKPDQRSGVIPPETLPASLKTSLRALGHITNPRPMRIGTSLPKQNARQPEQYGT
ncbi:hypothetical protein U91I_00029 [alpha proteobacterium U9-1i]|nr:hypothetical protein U91I_00029 [alpha proteobacterium U9-1i]